MRCNHKGLFIFLAGMVVAGCSASASNDPSAHLEQAADSGKSPVASTSLVTSALPAAVTPSPVATPVTRSQNVTASQQANVKTPDRTQFPGVVFHAGSHSNKQVALTFDDGPDVRYTAQILDILKQNGIKATFFVVGTRAQAHPEMIRRMANEGHAIGNHTWDHPNLSKLTADQVHTELDQTEHLLQSILGYSPSIFRPPYGSASVNVIQETGGMGYKVIDWSVDTRDWEGTAAPQIMNLVRKELQPGGIILQHCAGGKGQNLNNTVQALPEIVSSLKAQGYKFVTVPELLQIKASM